MKTRALLEAGTCKGRIRRTRHDWSSVLMKTIVPRQRLLSMEKSELVDGLIATFLCGSIVRQGRCRVTSIPWIWLAQGRLTRETFDNAQAITLLLLLGLAVLWAIVALAVRLGHSKDDQTEN